MKDKILFSAQELHAAQASKSCLVFDCRFVLSDPGSGYRDYLDAHIPGAVYAHLDDDLSSPITGSSGRHPLPDAEKFAAFLARSGWRPGTRLVAYDLADGSIAARLWWLMKYFGHDCVALLDGGFQAWQSAAFVLESGSVTTAGTTPVSLRARGDMVVSTADILDSLGNPNRVLADVRASERFRGEIEPIDPVAGHVPGSVNFPFQLNLSANGSFKPVAEVRESLMTLAGRHQPEDLVYMCGSGVTACHTLFAAELAGLEGSRLYAGSWSEWIRDPSRPVEPKTD
jgi:thiosulfate/3-mercaptopyruvate sulfurtransferase